MSQLRYSWETEGLGTLVLSWSNRKFPCLFQIKIYKKPFGRSGELSWPVGVWTQKSLVVPPGPHSLGSRGTKTQLPVHYSRSYDFRQNGSSEQISKVVRVLKGAR